MLQAVTLTVAGHAHTAHWGRVKSLLILFVATVLMSLCAEVITSNIQPLLESGLSVVSL